MPTQAPAGVMGYMGPGISRHSDEMHAHALQALRAQEKGERAARRASRAKLIAAEAGIVQLAVISGGTEPCCAGTCLWRAPF